MEIDKDADLGTKNFGNDGNRDVVDGAATVALYLVGVGKMHARNEDDCGLLETRMLANHIGQFEAVEIRHAHVHQHHGHIILQEDVEGLAGSGRLDEVLAQFCQNDLVTQQLGRLVIDHQDIDSVICPH